MSSIDRPGIRPGCLRVHPVEPYIGHLGLDGVGDIKSMLESMVTATVQNIAEELAGKEPSHKATWNAFCLADLRDRGVAFMALPQILPRNTNWSGSGKQALQPSMHLTVSAVSAPVFTAAEARPPTHLLRGPTAR